MADNTTTTRDPEDVGGDEAGASRETAARLLGEQVEHFEKQLIELESDMAGMLRDHDTIQEDLDQTRALIETVRGDLQRAQRALERIDAGTYGQCVDCGSPIAEARLEAIPEVERCTDCA